MKRILPLILTVLLLPSLLAVPARADEVTESSWIELLDYGYSNSGSNSIVLSGSPTLVQYSLPDNFYVHSVDLIFRSDADVYRIEANAKSLTVVSLGDGLYRAYGDVDVRRNFAYFWVYYNSGSYLDVLSFKVSSVSSIYRTLPAQMTGFVWDGQEFHLNYDGSLVYTSWSGGNATADYRRFSSYLIVRGNVHAYDYIDVDLTLSVSGIQSISVDDGFSPLPYEINNIYQPSDTVGTMPNVLVSLRIDVRSLENGFLPYIRITGDSSSGGNIYQINYVGGVVVIDPPSPLTFWFSQVGLWFSEQTFSLSTGFASIVDSIGSNFDRLSLWFTGLTDNLRIWFVSQNEVITNAGNHVATTFANNFERLASWWSTLTSNLRGWFTEQTTAINTWGQNIVNAINPPVDTDDMKNEVENIRDQMQDANDVMNELQRPDIDDVFHEVQLDIGTGSPFADIMSGLFANDFIVTIVTGSLAFTLFGILVG